MKPASKESRSWCVSRTPKGENKTDEPTEMESAGDLKADCSLDDNQDGHYMTSRNVYVLIYRRTDGLSLSAEIDHDGGVAEISRVISDQLGQEESKEVKSGESGWQRRTGLTL